MDYYRFASDMSRLNKMDLDIEQSFRSLYLLIQENEKCIDHSTPRNALEG